MRKKTNVRTRQRGGALRGLILTLSLGALGALTACDLDSLLEVEAPDQITAGALEDPGAAGLLVNSIIAHFECGYSGFLYDEGGKSDTFDRIAGAGAGGGSEGYGNSTVSTSISLCSGPGIGYTWAGSIQLARGMGMRTYEDLTGWSDQQVAGDREKLQATAALYAGAALNIFGEFFCETALDIGPLMTQDETLALAEEWVNIALGHIANTGDFELEHGATTSIETLAYGLRARIRWARGPSYWADARTDALRVPQGYTAWVVRENSPTRQNKVYEVATDIGVAVVMGPFTHWVGPPNPVTGLTWPNPIPFTGYLDLGIMPDGRVIGEDQYPITTTGSPGAIPDPRVVTRIQKVQGPDPGPVPVKYTSADEDMPLVSWNDMWLIRAEIDGGQAAIDLVNELRVARGLPIVTYANPADADQILDMIIEERRRDLWLEGRFWSTKIQHTDRLWFPRSFGSSLFQGFPYYGAVTLIMAENEYELNPNLSLADRATGCVDSKMPTVVD